MVVLKDCWFGTGDWNWSSDKHVSAILKAIFHEHEGTLRLLSRLNFEGYKMNPTGDSILRVSLIEITGGWFGGPNCAQGVARGWRMTTFGEFRVR